MEMTGNSHLLAKVCTFSISTILEHVNIEGTSKVVEATGHLHSALQ